MKALECLQMILELDENKYHGGRAVVFSSEDFKYIREAVAELEGLMREQKIDQVNAAMSQQESVDLLNRLEALENESCDGCKYLIENDDCGYYCFHYEHNPEKFHCARMVTDYWEAKQ